MHLNKHTPKKNAKIASGLETEERKEHKHTVRPGDVRSHPQLTAQTEATCGELENENCRPLCQGRRRSNKSIRNCSAVMWTTV